MQGQFEPGKNFLVSLPIPLNASVVVELTSAQAITSQPEWKQKARQAVRLALDSQGRLDLGAKLEIRSEIPEGKGLASSSAEVTAAVQATFRALGRSVSPETISSIATAIEPTDAVMYAPESVCYDHRNGVLIESLGVMPAAEIFIVDFGGQLDTVAFNRIPKRYHIEAMRQLREAYDLMKEGFRKQDLSLIGRAATSSGRLNQSLNFKPYLEPVTWLANDCGADGVVCAHSGTVVGALFKPGTPGARHFVASLSAAHIPFASVLRSRTLAASGKGASQ